MVLKTLLEQAKTRAPGAYDDAMWALTWNAVPENEIIEFLQKKLANA